MWFAKQLGKVIYYSGHFLEEVTEAHRGEVATPSHRVSSAAAAVTDIY